MSDELVMIDTNVISEATKDEPRKDWGEWIDAHPRLAIPFPVWSEIQLGISSLTTNPKKRAELEDWLAELRASEYVAPPMNEEVALLYGEMMACKPLSHLWMTVPSKNKIKVKSDLLIAAIAIVHSLPFATYDIVDFGRIDSYFKMPKLIYPGVPPLILPKPAGVTSRRRKAAANAREVYSTEEAADPAFRNIEVGSVIEPCSPQCHSGRERLEALRSLIRDVVSAA
jgi:predicted nucleic acid-binding protein